MATNGQTRRRRSAAQEMEIPISELEATLDLKNLKEEVLVKDQGKSYKYSISAANIKLASEGTMQINYELCLKKTKKGSAGYYNDYGGYSYGSGWKTEWEVKVSNTMPLSDNIMDGSSLDTRVLFKEAAFSKGIIIKPKLLELLLPPIEQKLSQFCSTVQQEYNGMNTQANDDQDRDRSTGKPKSGTLPRR